MLESCQARCLARESCGAIRTVRTKYRGRRRIRMTLACDTGFYWLRL